MVGFLPAMPLTTFLLRRHAHHLRDSGKLAELAEKARAIEAAEARGEGQKKLITLPVACCWAWCRRRSV